MQKLRHRYTSNRPRVPHLVSGKASTWSQLVCALLPGTAPSQGSTAISRPGWMQHAPLPHPTELAQNEFLAVHAQSLSPLLSCLITPATSPSPSGYLKGTAVLETRGRMGGPWGPPPTPSEPLPRAEYRPAYRMWASSPQGWGERSVLQLKDAICKSMTIIYNVTPHCCSFQSSVSSYQVLISPRPCFLGTWLLLRLALITLDQAGRMLFVLIETLRVHLLLAAGRVLVLRGGERA